MSGPLTIGMHHDEIQQVVARTNVDSKAAKDVLKDQSWDVEAAVRTLNFLKNATLPPMGPAKNIENNAAISVKAGGERKENGMFTSGGIDYRKLKRGLSKTTENVQLVNRARDLVLHDIAESREDTEQHFVDTPEYTFILPDLTQHPADFRAFLHKDLIETSTLVSLEQAGRLNWWADMGACQRLLPLATTGDGNCLLHAASLGMWGFHDRLLTLRRALFNTLNSGSNRGAFWRRWRWHQTAINKQSGLILNEKEWQTEWSNLTKLASTTPKTNPGSRASCCDSPMTKGMMERHQERDSGDEDELFYESLEEFHVFVLAHVLRRPIIVVADTVLKNCSGEALAPIPFGGLYLPLESRPEDCHRSPLILTYDAAHFSALVPMENDRSAQNGVQPAVAIPLVDPEFKLLPLHFLVDPGPQFTWNRDETDSQTVQNLELATEDRLELIRTYLDVLRVPIPTQPGSGDTGSESGGSEGGRPRSSSWSGAKPFGLQRTTSMESNDSGQSGHSGIRDSKVVVANGGPDVKNGKPGKARSRGSFRKNKDKGKDAEDKEGDKDKARSSKQMQSVVKSFGSLGKTMSRKLKKNFGGIGKGLKGTEDGGAGQGGGRKQRKASIGSVTQSTKTSSLTAEMLRDRDHIVCARLLHKRLEYQDEMVRNYLEAASKRFGEDRELRRRRDDEMRHRAGELGLRQQQQQQQQQLQQQQQVETHCVNAGCQGRATAATSYLCDSCYDKHKDEEINHRRPASASGAADVRLSGAAHNAPGPRVSGSGSGSEPGGVVGQEYVHGTVSVTKVPPLRSEFTRQNTLVNVGTSKFYTYADEDQMLSARGKSYADGGRPGVTGGLGTVVEGRTHLNNVPGKEQKYPSEQARPSFIAEPLSMRTSAASASAASRGVQPAKAAAPGTAVFINNLHGFGETRPAAAGHVSSRERPARASIYPPSKVSDNSFYDDGVGDSSLRSPSRTHVSRMRVEDAGDVAGVERPSKTATSASASASHPVQAVKYSKFKDADDRNVSTGFDDFDGSRVVGSHVTDPSGQARYSAAKPPTGHQQQYPSQQVSTVSATASSAVSSAVSSAAGIKPSTVVDQGYGVVKVRVDNTNVNLNRSSSRTRPCQADGCPFFGSEATDFLCSSCYKHKQQTLACQASRL